MHETAVTTGTTDENHLRYPGWRVAGAASVGVFVGFASLFVYTFGIFLKPLSEDFGWSRQAVSSAFGIAAMCIAVCSPLLGLALDRFGPVRVIAPCVAIFGLAFAALGSMNGALWQLYAICAVLGCVGNGTAHMAYSRAVATWFSHRRGLALAVMMSGGAIGALVLPALAQWLIGALGWRLTYLGLGLGVLAIGLPNVLALVRERPRDVSGASAPNAGATVRSALATYLFWLLVVVLFVSSIAQNGALAHLPALLSDRGVGASGAALALSALGAASLVGRLSTGWFLDRFWAAYVSCVLLGIAAAGVLLLSSAQTLGQGVVAAVLIGFGMGGESDVTPYLLARYYGLRSFATLYGWTWTAYAIAGAVGPIVMGRAFDLQGSYAGVLAWMALGTALTGVLMLTLRRAPASDAVRVG
ncbi:MAG TPA: MFS transporter [Luteitalea sp.]|nr:MFS transporter [Luteitalea sp.]